MYHILRGSPRAPPRGRMCCLSSASSAAAGRAARKPKAAPGPCRLMVCGVPFRMAGYLRYKSVGGSPVSCSIICTGAVSFISAPGRSVYVNRYNYRMRLWGIKGPRISVEPNALQKRSVHVDGGVLSNAPLGVGLFINCTGALIFLYRYTNKKEDSGGGAKENDKNHG